MHGPNVAEESQGPGQTHPTESGEPRPAPEDEEPSAVARQGLRPERVSKTPITPYSASRRFGHSSRTRILHRRCSQPGRGRAARSFDSEISKGFPDAGAVSHTGHRFVATEDGGFVLGPHWARRGNRRQSRSAHQGRACRIPNGPPRTSSSRTIRVYRRFPRLALRGGPHDQVSAIRKRTGQQKENAGQWEEYLLESD